MKSLSRPPHQKINAAVLIAVMAACGPNLSPAQMLEHPFSARGSAQIQARAHPQKDAKGSPRLHLDGSSTRKQEHIDPVRDHLDTIPYWTGQFTWHGITYPYTMVGTDPTLGSATTVIPTFIIPLKIVLPDGSVFDSNKDVIDGQTAIQGIVNSPLFQAYPFVSGGTHVGNTQYSDAAQRANFWNYVSTRSPDYHVLLSQPVVLPEQTINVPANEGGYYQDPTYGPIPYVDDDFFNPAIKALTAQLGINSRQLPIFVTGSVELSGGSGAAYHGAWYVSSTSNSIGGAQTYIATTYSGVNKYVGVVPDVYPLSHELNEWMCDPFINNYTPGWDLASSSSAQCDSFLFGSRDLMEVCDVIEDGPQPFTGIQLHGVTYHLTDRVFLDFFTRNARSRSVNGQFSFFGGAVVPSADCTGHLEITYNVISIPNSVATVAFGMNNRGQVVGIYVDASNNVHGFLTDGKKFTSIDYPGAVATNIFKINDAGLMVGPYVGADGLDHSFSYQNGHFRAIDFPGAVTTDANGVNSLGDIVGQYTDGSGLSHGFTLSQGKYQRNDAPSYSNTALTFINDFGLMSGYSYNDPVNGPYAGFIKAGKNFIPFRYPGATFVEPNCINNSGNVTGIFMDDDGYGDGFTTVFGYPYEIDVAYGLYGLNDLGQIVGTTFDTDGVLVGFTAQLPTSPVNH